MKLALITAKRFERIAHSLRSGELVRGEFIPKSPSRIIESLTVGCILMRLCNCLKHDDKLGRVMTNRCGIVTDELNSTVRGADILYISYERCPKNGVDTDRFLSTPPELIVEVKGKDDRWNALKEKVDEYHKLGVDLVWLVDPKTRTVRIYPKGSKPILKHDQEMIDGGVALPKFTCKIERFFED